MHIVIGGFGRVGRNLAHSLEQQGHTVAVIDHDREVFDEFGADLKGLKIAAEVFDREALLHAGIEKADAFAAVTSGDNSNIVSARVARERFGVPNVMARIYDPRRAAIYEQFGIPTVASVSWTTARLVARIMEPGLNLDTMFGGGEVLTVSAEIPASLTGKRVLDIERPGDISVTAIVRGGEALLPAGRLELVKGDKVHVTLVKESLGELKQLLGLEGRS